MDSLRRKTGKALARQEGARLPQLWPLRLRWLCRWQDRAPAGTSLCHTNICTHTACSSPLDATVIQLSLHQLKPLEQYLIAGSFTAIMNSALMTLTTGPSKECGCQAVYPPLNPCRLSQYNEYTSTSQLSFLQTKPHSTSLGFCFNSNGLVIINFTDIWTSLPPPPKKNPTFSVQSTVRSSSSRILYLGPRPKSFLKAKPSCNTVIKMTAECIFSCGLPHIWFRPSGLWERRIYEAVWFMFIHICVSLPCSQFAKMSINCMSGIFQTVLIYCYCCYHYCWLKP